jgi:putative ABC transport system permease protein
MNDLRYALRTLRRSPGFTAVAVLTLALGIGATTAMFTVVRGVLLEPLPYERPDELVALWTRYLPSSGQDIPQFPLSPPEMMDYRDQTRLMRDVVPYGVLERTVGGDAVEPRRVRIGFLGAGMFDLLGVRAAVGRAFAPEEELPGATPVVVLSHGMWRDRFGGDPAAVGRSVAVNGVPARVVGVMPSRFVFPDASVELWLPFGLDESTATNRFAHYLLAVGRLAPGATFEQAERELEVITEAWSAEHEHHAVGHFIFPRRFHDELVGDRRHALWLLMAAVAGVLLIAAANIANLMLVRAESRQGEVAVRAALGAGRGRLARQFLAESLVLAAAGAALGILIAAWATPVLLAIHPAAVPRSEGIRVDAAVVMFALLIGVGTALLVGLIPGARRPSAAYALAAGRATADASRSRLRGALLGAEAALGVVVILSAGVVARSYVELTRVDPGVRADGLLLFELQLPPGDYPPGDVPDAYAGLLARLRALPGVRQAGATSSLPVAHDPTRQDIGIEGRPEPPPGVPRANADIVAVHPGTLEALGVPLIEGRPLGPGDRAGSDHVAIINATAARRFWPAGDAIGSRFRYSEQRPWITVVGVVGDTRVDGLFDDGRAQVYLPHSQLRSAQGSTGAGLTIVVRTGQHPAELAPAVREVVRELDARIPVANLRTMSDVLGTAVAPHRFTAGLLSAFAFLTLLLAAVGVYGVASYAVTRRTREIGIRMALGARGRDVLARTVGEGLRAVAVGAAVGLAVGMAGAGALSRFVFGVGVRDPVTFTGGPLLLLIVAAAAAYVPARRAARVDPIKALRHE